MPKCYENSTSAARTRPRVARGTHRYRYVRTRWHILFAIVDAIGGFCWRLMRALRLSKRPAGAQPDPRTILIVQLDHLGDAVMTTSLLPLLKQRYPAARLEILASPWNRAVFEARPEVDLVHVSRINRFARRASRGWFFAMIAWGIKLRGRQIDLAIDVRGEFPLAMVLWLCGARQRIGWDCGGGGFLLTQSADFQRGRPEVLSRRALLTAIGLELSEADAPGPQWCIQPDVRRGIEQQMANWRVAGRPLCVLHVGAGTQAKRWPSAHWRELLGRILLELNGQVILVGGPTDRNIAAQITEQQIWPDVYDWSGCLTLGELAALAAMADIFVGADSGPAHVAAASQANVIVLFSGTNHLQQWRPWGSHVSVMHEPVACSPCHREVCPWSDHPCMQRLTPASVLARMTERLAAAQTLDAEHALQHCAAGTDLLTATRISE